MDFVTASCGGQIYFDLFLCDTKYSEDAQARNSANPAAYQGRYIDTRDAGALGNEKNDDNDEEKAFIDKSCTMHIANINLSFEKATSVALNKANRELFISPLFPLIICSLPLQFLVFFTRRAKQNP